MNKEELELYDMVLNSEKSFDVNYKELAISLRAELELYKDNEEYLNNKIDKAIEDIEFCLISIKQEEKMSTDERTRIEMESCKRILEELLDILKGIDNE